MPRQRLYNSNAERQAAYRGRLAVRQAQVNHAPLAVRVEQLEAALAAMTARAETAERRAVEAERQAELGTGQARTLKLSLAALQHQLEATAARSSNSGATTGMNRQARRGAERNARRRRQ